jgi:hypothetical protein
MFESKYYYCNYCKAVHTYKPTCPGQQIPGIFDIFPWDKTGPAENSDSKLILEVERDHLERCFKKKAAGLVIDKTDKYTLKPGWDFSEIREKFKNFLDPIKDDDSPGKEL